MPIDNKFLDSGDIFAADLYAKKLSSSQEFCPVTLDESGNLCVNMTVGTFSYFDEA